jgi:UDP-N-acetylmuramoyl-tripeptide--D-alanyl-D-alanine ligase
VLARRTVDLSALPEERRAGIAYVRVADPLTALQKLASAHRERIEAGIIGVVGSVGKTTAKQTIAHVLARRFRVYESPANFNSEIGLPIALLEIGPDVERAVLEMGAYRVGEIATLCEIARPNAAVLTTIGPTHLESFGSMEAIEQAKGEILDALPESGLAVLNGDDQRLRRMGVRAACPIVWYGTAEHNAVRAIDIRSRGLAGVSFRLLYPGGEIAIDTSMIGRHAVYPCLAAAALALADEMDAEQIAAALVNPPDLARLRPITLPGGATLLDDTYNAAPISMNAALDVLAEHTGRRIAILGDMLELGEIEEEAHRAAGRRAAGAADVVWAVGSRARALGREARLAGLLDVHFADDVTDVAIEPLPGDLILVKGSRGLRMERLVRRLTSGPA